MTPINLCLLVFISILAVAGSKGFHCDEEHFRFKCDNGECISNHSRCDFKQDCKDGSDEADCVRRACDPREEYTCKNGRCISPQWKCDDEDDCYDNSDENLTLCANHTCRATEFRCKGKVACYPNSWKCDGDQDCDDGEDEMNCARRPCTESEFQCANLECIEARYTCDGEDDCADGSDEKGCSNTICKDTEFTCKTHPQCVPQKWLCDGTRDCADGTDEDDCTEVSPECPETYFACKSGFPECIPGSWKCDGNPECHDGSDELQCDNIIPRCGYREFHCNNKRQCIDIERRCDGARDCVDSSDEIGCPKKQDKTKCPASTHFQCPDADKTCIVSHRLCDNKIDCPGGEDELKGPHYCDYDECAVSNGNCSHICTNLRVGWQCECPPGYKLGDDKLACEDIDECKVPAFERPCDHFCLNTVGSYKCVCWVGHTLDHETGECKPSSAKYDVSIVMTEKDSIKQVDISSSSRSRHGKLLVPNISKIDGLALDIANNYVYWANTKDETISRSKMNDATSKPEVLLKKLLVKTPRNPVVDWVHGHLYWTDQHYESVSVSRLDGSYPKTLYRRQSYRKSSIYILSLAAHPKSGHLFISCSWTAASQHAVHSSVRGYGVIQRCGMDGNESSCVTFVNDTGGLPVDMAIDYNLDLLYWIDNELQTLSEIDVNGKNRKMILYTENYAPFSLAVFAGKIYWTETLESKLYSVNRTGGNLQLVHRVWPGFGDIAVRHVNAQPKSTNYCLNSPCKFLCLPCSQNGTHPHKYTCACPDGYVAKDRDATDCKMIAISPPPTITESNVPTRTTVPPMKPTTTISGESQSNAATSTEAAGMTAGTKAILVIAIIAFIVLCTFLLYHVYRWHQQRSERKSMNFNNPIYRKVNTASGSRSSLTPLDDRSLTGVEEDTTMSAQLVLHEELPEGSGQGAHSSKSNGRMYEKVSPHDVEYAGMPSNRYETVGSVGS